MRKSPESPRDAAEGSLYGPGLFFGGGRVIGGGREWGSIRSSREAMRPHAERNGGCFKKAIFNTGNKR
jgi:hypothetical protein